jgi:hypothetical protein
LSDQSQNSTAKKPFPRWVKGFLAALRESGNVRLSCEAVKIDRKTAYNLRDADEDFARAWKDALEESADLLEQEARRRAYEGVRRLKFDRGKLITIPLLDDEGKFVLGGDGEPLTTPYVEHEYSDTLLIFLLKGVRPEVYRERGEMKHTFDPVDWDKVPTDIRDAFIEGKVSLDDVRRLVSGTR